MRMDSRLIGLVIGTLATLMMGWAVLSAVFAENTGPYALLIDLTNGSTGTTSALDNNFARTIIYTGITLIPLGMFAGVIYWFIGMRAGRNGRGRRRRGRRGRRGGRGRRRNMAVAAAPRAIPVALGPRTR